MNNPEVRPIASLANLPKTAVRGSRNGNLTRSEDHAKWHKRFHVTQVVRARRSNPFLFGSGAARYRILKRSFDIAACVAAAPFALPIIGVCTLAVRLSSPGPVLFIQQRTGRGGQLFSILKIRTMVVDAESRKAALKQRDAVFGPDFKLTQDPRVTGSER